MTTPAQNQSQTPFRFRIGTLIEIFYGLAIASGIEHAASTLFRGPVPVDWVSFLLLSIAAFDVAIGDWMIYHLIIVKHEYKNVFRLILDIFFPTLIFALFQSATRINLYLFLYLIYFGLVICYVLLLKKEKWRPKKWLSIFLWIASPSILVVWLIRLIYPTCSGAMWVALILVIAVGIAYFVLNLLEANKELQNSNLLSVGK